MIVYKASILVVDDVIENLQLLCSMLEANGYEVRPVLTGSAAMRAASSARPDLILLDVSLGDTDGYAVCAALKTYDVLHDVPVIFISALHETENIVRGFAVGGVDYITKPFQVEEVLARVETHLGIYRKRHEMRQHYEQNLRRERAYLEQALEQEHEQHASKTRMVAMFAHDFRVPLSTILSSVSIIRKYADRLEESRRQEWLKRAEMSVRQLTHMIDDLLLSSQLESTQFALQREPVNIGAFVTALVKELYALHAYTHDLVLEVKTDCRLMTDVRLLRQIALNLISNAIKYSPEGGQISIVLDVDADHLVLRISDCGIGIPESDIARLFEPYQRGSNVNRIPGSGLGLMIVKQAVDLLGAMIDVQSQVGKGTSVGVRFPLKPNANDNRPEYSR